MLKYRVFIISLMLFFPLFSMLKPVQANQMEQTEKTFFSLKEVKEAPRQTPMPLQYIQASDETSLAFRAYLPEKTKAVLIFYHGGGAHSGLSYQHIGVGLSEQFNTAVYTPDIRGHGYSGGSRGDAPSDEQVWADINSMVKYVRLKHQDAPVFIGGHSAGAGLILNYATWEKRETVEGYAFVAPFFGFRSKTAHDEGKSDVEFSTVKVSSFVINSLSGGLFAGHSKAVQFNYPRSVIQENPEIVTFNTVNMSKAVTPHSPDKQLSALKQFGLWIGDKDEAFDPDKIVQFAHQNSNIKANKEIVKIDELNHFSIILDAAKHIGPWINSALE